MDTDELTWRQRFERLRDAIVNNVEVTESTGEAEALGYLGALAGMAAALEHGDESAEAKKWKAWLEAD